MLINKDFKKFKTVIREEYDKQEANNNWINSPLEKINALKNDYSGKVGERWLEKLCKGYELDCSYSEDQIDSEATYDLIINDLKVEVKTARFGKCKSFQHENLRSSGCDKYTFIDVLPNSVYITVIDSDFDYNRQHPILGRTPHLRKGTTDVYKFDFGKKTIKNGIESGITFELKERETDDGSLKEFLTNMFKQNKKTP
tara:strand:- start:3935 stop:4531 length:597 start_codon:yes stop_codon:yes gene_type:complete